MPERSADWSCLRVVQSFLELSAPHAIDETLTLDLGGSPQVVRIRGTDPANPVMVVAHGGPGTPLAPTAWMWQRPVEDYFTVVNYDQRGAGRSYRLSDPAGTRAAMTLEHYAHDLNTLSERIRDRLDVDRVLLAGHSWGTVVATRAAIDRPDLYRGYLGIGQVVNFRAGERQSFVWALQEAHRRGDRHAIEELEALAPYPGDGTFEPAKLVAQRKWITRFGGFAAGRDNCDYFIHGESTSPDYQGENLRSSAQGNALSFEVVVPQLPDVDFTDLAAFPVPMIQFLGRHDQMTPSALVPPWLSSLTAPHTAIEWFENSAHMPMYEEPGHFLAALLRHCGALG